MTSNNDPALIAAGRAADATAANDERASIDVQHSCDNPTTGTGADPTLPIEPERLASSECGDIQRHSPKNPHALRDDRPRFLDLAHPIPLSAFPNQPTEPNRGPPFTLVNFEYMLDRYDITVRYDVIKKRHKVLIPGHHGSLDNFDATALVIIESLMRLNFFNPQPVRGYLVVIGDWNPLNPVAEWITSHPWDGIDRLPRVYNTLRERFEYPVVLKKVLMYRWLLSAVAAALKPEGFYSRGVLTLQGPQGIGKTTWVRSLVSDPVLQREVVKGDQHIDANDKDTVLTAISHWLVEIGELESSLKKDMPRLKGFITAPIDKVRRPYGAADSEYQRRTVFTATVNEERFLIDHTGNSRFWTIAVEAIDYMHGIDMQQVYAQLAEDYERGEQWWLLPAEEAMLNEWNRAHQATSAVREAVLARLDQEALQRGEGEFYTSTALMTALGFQRPTNSDFKELTAVLTDMGLKKTRSRGQERWRFPMLALPPIGPTPPFRPPSIDDDDIPF